MVEVASAFKIAGHGAKIAAYLNDEPIYPATLELDITSACTRECVDCPSSRSTEHQYLSLDFIERLFGSLAGQTRGLLLTGGEPTMAPTFPQVLGLARRNGFANLAVVTNGSLLESEGVAESLITHASTIRVSSYDWSEESCDGLEPVLEKITTLRKRIDESGSGLKIGVSALTSTERIPALDQVVRATCSAGAHWIYFHPMCTEWRSGAPIRVDQTGVLGAIESCRQQSNNDFQVHVSPQRYLFDDLVFNGYHAAHFLLVIGADGLNYLGAEVKYYPGYAIADIAGNSQTDFLWRTERLERIRRVNHRNYRAINSRHRGVLYNHYIEALKQQAQKRLESVSFQFPHIL
jgi:organic radical activating enzyme